MIIRTVSLECTAEEMETLQELLRDFPGQYSISGQWQDPDAPQLASHRTLRVELVAGEASLAGLMQSLARFSADSP